MGNNPKEAQRLADERQKQSDKDHRDFMSGLAGVDVPSVWGQAGIRIATGPSPSPTTNPSSAVGNFPLPSPAPRSSQPWLSGVDKWVDTIPKSVFWTLGLVGAICGLGFGLSTGDLTKGFWCALLGGFVGLVFINILAKIYKLVVAVLLIAFVGFVLYVIFHAAGH